MRAWVALQIKPNGWQPLLGPLQASWMQLTRIQRRAAALAKADLVQKWWVNFPSYKALWAVIMLLLRVRQLMWLTR